MIQVKRNIPLDRGHSFPDSITRTPKNSNAPGKEGCNGRKTSCRSGSRGRAAARSLWALVTILPASARSANFNHGASSATPHSPVESGGFRRERETEISGYARLRRTALLCSLRRRRAPLVRLRPATLSTTPVFKTGMPPCSRTSPSAKGTRYGSAPSTSISPTTPTSEALRPILGGPRSESQPAKSASAMSSRRCDTISSGEIRLADSLARFYDWKRRQWSSSVRLPAVSTAQSRFVPSDSGSRVLARCFRGTMRSSKMLKNHLTRDRAPG